ncbi:MAG: DSD1 family PLP-dependent enzyme [Pseudomonadota bacterium]
MTITELRPALDARPNAGRVGQPGSRAKLSTPALLLDLPAFERNLADMAAWAKQAGLELRPHAKTHKCSEIAKRQVAAGALGNCCATLGEAEVLVAAGIPGVLLTSTVVTDDKIARLVALNERAQGLMVIVDDGENVDALAAALSPERPLGILIDVEVGSERTGVVELDDAVDLAKRIAGHASLRFKGLQAYDGSAQATTDYHARRQEADDRMAHLQAVCASLVGIGLTPEIVSGGGTGTHDLDSARGVFTEIQAGSYIVMDTIYNACDLRGGGTGTFETSVFVRTSVISRSHPGFVTTDAGLKAFSVGFGDPVIACGAPQGATYSFMGDEHGRITFANGADALGLGAAVECIAPHCDPTISLYDAYHVVDGDTLVDIWPIDGRGHW